MIRLSFMCLLVPWLLASTGTLAQNESVANLTSPTLPAPEDRDGEHNSVFEVPTPPVIIEGELPHLEPTPEELIRHFRESLNAPPSFLSTERRLADGTVEVMTRFGRICAPSLPLQTSAGLGGGVRLAARCASF